MTTNKGTYDPAYYQKNKKRLMENMKRYREKMAAKGKAPKGGSAHAAPATKSKPFWKFW